MKTKLYQFINKVLKFPQIKYIVIILSLMVFTQVLLFPKLHNTFFSNVFLFRTLLVLILAFTLVTIKMKPIRKYEFFKYASTSLILIISLFFLFLFITMPLEFDSLAHEDKLIEATSATVVFIGSLFFIYLAFTLKTKIQKIICILFFLIFFLIAGEEISWGQRILGIITPEKLGEINAQNEFNFHNIFTDPIQLNYHFLGTIFLTALPLVFQFFKIKINKDFSLFIPSSWLAIPFSAMWAFHVNFHFPSIQLGLFFTLFVMLNHLKTNVKNKDTINSFFIFAFLSFTVAGAFIIYLNRYNLPNPWLQVEYLEFYIALGFMLYSIDLFIKTKYNLQS